MTRYRWRCHLCAAHGQGWDQDAAMRGLQAHYAAEHRERS